MTRLALFGVLAHILLLILISNVLLSTGTKLDLVDIVVVNKSTAGVNEPLKLCLSLTNEHDTEIENAIVTFLGGEYFSKQQRLPKLPPQQPVEICSQLNPRLRAVGPSLLDIPPSLLIKVESSDGNVIGEYEHVFLFVDFIGKLKQYTPKNANAKYRILTVGIQGAGKSSFINSAFAMMYGNPAIQGTAAGYGTEATTRIVREFHLPNVSVALVDTWGLNDQNIDSFPIDILIDGNYDKLNMEGKNTATKTAGPDLRFKSAHAILFFIDYEMINEENIDGFFKEAWRKVSVSAEKKGVPILIVITKLDNMDKNFLTNSTLPLVAPSQAELLKARGIHANLISYVLVYHGERRNSNWNIDRSIYDVLDTVLSFAHLVQPVKPERTAECVTLWRQLQITRGDGFISVVSDIWSHQQRIYLLFVLLFVVSTFFSLIFLFELIRSSSCLACCCGDKRYIAVPQQAGAAPAALVRVKTVPARRFKWQTRLTFSLGIGVLIIGLIPFASDWLVALLCRYTQYFM